MVAEKTKQLSPIEIKGCGICGGKMVFIRGKYPKDKKRKICPTCTYERLEQIHEISDENHRKAYTSK